MVDVALVNDEFTQLNHIKGNTQYSDAMPNRAFRLVLNKCTVLCSINMFVIALHLKRKRSPVSELRHRHGRCCDGL